MVNFFGILICVGELISIPGGENQGQKIAAATYLKNFTRKNVEGDVSSSAPKVSKEFKDQLLRDLLQSEPAVVKVLVEVVCNLLC